MDQPKKDQDGIRAGLPASSDPEVVDGDESSRPVPNLRQIPSGIMLGLAKNRFTVLLAGVLMGWTAHAGCNMHERHQAKQAERDRQDAERVKLVDQTLTKLEDKVIEAIDNRALNRAEKAQALRDTFQELIHLRGDHGSVLRRHPEQKARADKIHNDIEVGLNLLGAMKD